MSKGCLNSFQIFLAIDLGQSASRFGNRVGRNCTATDPRNLGAGPFYRRYTLFQVKRWHYFAMGAAVLAAGGYWYLQDGAAIRNWFSSSSPRNLLAVSAGSQWHRLDRPGDGFKVELPGQAQDSQAPAYNETGGSEAVHMLIANPGNDVTYAISWQDNPPVARVSHSVDRTLYMARDGMLARTETTILSESRGFYRDFPSLDVLARNNQGGILNGRLVLADDRLYMLIALFPSATDRREKDVQHFFNSFVPARPGGIPETVPEASPQQ